MSAVALSPLNAISPIDGRYWRKVSSLSDFSSEASLFKHRVWVEVEYLIALSESAAFRARVPDMLQLDAAEKTAMRQLYAQFGADECARVKELERSTNHDIKAVEYFLKERFDAVPRWAPHKEWLHFALTSQDVNNTALPLMLYGALDHVLVPALAATVDQLRRLGVLWLDVPMLARTHGQPATPTRVGKELLVFVERLARQMRMLAAVPRCCKFGGATGTFGAHHVAMPDVDWCALADELCARLGLERLQYTTQIEHYDMMAATFDALARINTILIDLARDVWQYISLGYFTQAVVAGEVGSSAMPHKVNPIDFENAEGNCGLANSLFRHMAEKLPISRLQRDLSDSTVLRNIGVPLSHTLLALQSLQAGLAKLSLNRAALAADLDANWQVLSEAIQTILRRERYTAPYEALKALTRGASAADAPRLLREFVGQLQVSDSVRAELLALTPATFIGTMPKALP
jgi:adenylosuccinate lyase